MKSCGDNLRSWRQDEFDFISLPIIKYYQYHHHCHPVKKK